MKRQLMSRWLAAAILTVSILGLTVTTGPAPARMAAAATEFLKSLTPEQRQQATFAFGDSERTHWHFVPTEIFARNGLTLKQMSPAQRQLAHELYGTLVAGAPTFFGSNPAEVRDGPKKGTRVLALVEDAARSLLESLDSTQRATAIINATAPNDIVTVANVKIDPLSPVGIPAAALTSNQRALLKALVDVYAGYLADDIAAGRLARIEQAGWDNVAFAWAGALERGQKHYYRVQGPTFLIEYDNTQTDANHIHSVWRDFQGDFGADLLREHVNGTPHND